MTTHDNFEKMIQCFGSQAELSRLLDVHPMVISNWKKRGVAAKYCKVIENLSGGKVTAEELRPDIFMAA